MPRKSLKLKGRFRGKKSGTSEVETGLGSESLAQSGPDDDSNSDLSDGEDDFFMKNSRSRFQLERTWSVNAFQISGHSTGLIRIDGSDDDSEEDVYTDDDSSNDEFMSDGNDDSYVTDEDDDDEDNTTAKTTNETRVGKTRRTPSRKKKGGSSALKSKTSRSARRSSVNRFKKGLKKRDAAPDIIPEGNEDEEATEVEDISNSNDDDNEDDANSLSYFNTVSSRGAPLLASKDEEFLDSGYSSDSALVRKRMAMIQQQQEEARRKENEGKKKKGGKKKLLTKKKEKKKGKNKSLEKEKSVQNGSGSLEGDSTVTTISVESDEEARQANDAKVDKSGKKKKKKKKKKSTNSIKNGKEKKKRAVISFLVDGDDEACENFDKRLQELEELEASLVEERKSMQKERETMAFERESMEMRLDEEVQRCDELNNRIKELEQLVQSQEISNAGNDAESTDEKTVLKNDFAREKREFHLALVEKEKEIEDLKLAVRDLKSSQDSKNGEEASFDSSNIADGKSRERLQGELLQTVAKLSEKEAQLVSQGKELDLARQELSSLKDGKDVLDLKKLLVTSQETIKKIQQELENERNENATKLKDKDETVTFLMNELARLKLASSKAR